MSTYLVIDKTGTYNKNNHPFEDQRKKFKRNILFEGHSCQLHFLVFLKYKFYQIPHYNTMPILANYAYYVSLSCY